jgi:hypothetical protein
MKLILSTIVVGVVLFLLGWLIYGVLFADYFHRFFGHIQRPMAEMKIWAFGVANLVQAFFMYMIYAKGYKGGSPVMEGFRFGFLIGLFLSVPYMFMTWGGMPVMARGAAADAIVCLFMFVIAGVITGIIHGKKDVAGAKAG